MFDDNVLRTFGKITVIVKLENLKCKIHMCSDTSAQAVCRMWIVKFKIHKSYFIPGGQAIHKNFMNVSYRATFACLFGKQQELKSLSIHACQDLMGNKYSTDLSVTNNLSAADLREIEAN